MNLLDSFLCRTPVQQQDVWAVQLAAVACLSIAAKYEEVYIPPNIAAFQVSTKNLSPVPNLDLSPGCDLNGRQPFHEGRLYCSLPPHASSI